MKPAIYLWPLRIVPAVILLQTLFFKFTASEESVYIFSRLGAEPYGRIGSGVIELAAAILLLIPRTTLFGAILAFGIMAGAIASHLLVLGIVVQDDCGTLFTLAIVTLVCSFILILYNRNKLYLFIKNKSGNGK